MLRSKPFPFAQHCVSFSDLCPSVLFSHTAEGRFLFVLIVFCLIERSLTLFAQVGGVVRVHPDICFYSYNYGAVAEPLPAFDFLLSH